MIKIPKTGLVQICKEINFFFLTAYFPLRGRGEGKDINTVTCVDSCRTAGRQVVLSAPPCGGGGSLHPRRFPVLWRPSATSQLHCGGLLSGHPGIVKLFSDKLVKTEVYHSYGNACQCY